MFSCSELSPALLPHGFVMFAMFVEHVRAVRSIQASSHAHSFPGEFEFQMAYGTSIKGASCQKLEMRPMLLPCLVPPSTAGR